MVFAVVTGIPAKRYQRPEPFSEEPKRRGDAITAKGGEGL